MVANVGDDEYGRLSVSAQHYADCEIVESVPNTAFDPQPAVQSAIVRLLPRTPDYEVDDEQFFLDFVKAILPSVARRFATGFATPPTFRGLGIPTLSLRRPTRRFSVDGLANSHPRSSPRWQQSRPTTVGRRVVSSPRGSESTDGD